MVINRLKLTWCVVLSFGLLAAALGFAGSTSADDKPAAAADGAKASDVKASEAKVPEAKASEAKAAEQTAAEQKAPEAKAPDAKAPEAKASEQKAEDPAAAKPAGESAEKPAAKPAAESSGGAHGGDHADHGDHGGGHHDPHDLSHANASPSLTDVKELKADLAIYTLLSFLLLFGLLLKFAWGPIMQGLSKRENAIAQAIETAKLNAEKSERAAAEYQKKLAAATEEIRAMQADARREAEQLRESIVGEARAAAQRERERAVEDIAAAKNVALAEIAQTSVTTAIGLARRILQRELNSADQAQLIREALEQFPSKN